METWPDIAHNIARFTHTCCIVIIDSTFLYFFGVESHDFAKHLLKMRTFCRRISSPKRFLKRPKLKRLVIQPFWGGNILFWEVP